MVFLIEFQCFVIALTIKTKSLNISLLRQYSFLIYDIHIPIRIYITRSVSMNTYIDTINCRYAILSSF